MTYCRQMKSYDLERCRALAAAIDSVAQSSGAYHQQRGWTDPQGAPVYGDTPLLDPAMVTDEFLANIPRQSFFFTGWNPPPDIPRFGPFERILWGTASLLSPRLGFLGLLWLSSRSPLGRLNAACKDGPPAETRDALLRSFTAGLPAEYVLGENFDATELDRVAMQERLYVLHRGRVLEGLRNSRNPVILEIGAGYGALALAIKRIVPKATYIIVDLPSSLCRSGCYLATRSNLAVNVYSGGDFTVDPGSIALCLSTVLPETRFDLAINTLSFGEMPESTVSQYAAFIRRNLAPTARLFEQNFDNSHCRRPNFCDPARALMRHLRLEKTISGLYLKGSPRLWSAAP